MKITLDYTKSVHENASDLFNKAKKAKAKLPGIEKAISEAIVRAQKSAEKKAQKSTRQKQWFEKFHWFIAQNGMLAIGGRDAKTNEDVIKKHVENHDLVFHTDMAGSPFFVLKTQGKDVSQQVKEEVAQMTAVYSRGWQKGFASLAVFYVKPEQVSKQAQSGESLGKGAFMIYGETTYIRPSMEIYVGVDEKNCVQVGTKDSVAKLCKKPIKVIQGNTKTSDIAKQLHKLIGGPIDEFVKQLPTGGCKIAKQ